MCLVLAIAACHPPAVPRDLSYDPFKQLSDEALAKSDHGVIGVAGVSYGPPGLNVRTAKRPSVFHGSPPPFLPS